MYRYTPTEEFIERLMHLRDLHRHIQPTNQFERLASERRELIAKYLVSNYRKTGDHPTLKTLLEVATNFSLTLEGAHSLFGYDLESIRLLELSLNQGRTHIVESQNFSRDRIVDVPLELADYEAFGVDSMIADLVLQWQSPAPFRGLTSRIGWHRSAFYVHVGTEDSYGTGLPPGAMGLVEPISAEEAKRPNPRAIYLLQFSNGYRCSRCVVSRGKLHLLTSTRQYTGPQEFSYPGSVRLAGRIKRFAHVLPQPEYEPTFLGVGGYSGAALILPWEHPSRDRLLATKHKRFRRSDASDEEVRGVLNTLLGSKMSRRTERRYRRPTQSEPHVNALIQLAITHFARYSDALHAGHQLSGDAHQYSLGTLLDARTLPIQDLAKGNPHLPVPSVIWKTHGNEFMECPSLFAAKLPGFRLRDHDVLRIAREWQIKGLEPSLAAGSWMLLDKVHPESHLTSERMTGWSRPLYVLRRNLEVLVGYLEREGPGYVLLMNPNDAASKLATFGVEEHSKLRRVAAVAVPV